MGPVEKILYPVGVIFKGSGFYSTDYKKSGGAESSESSSSKSSEGSPSSGESKSESKSETKTESKSSETKAS